MSRRGLRLGSGLVLFGYVALHLLNHSLGLISVAAAEAGMGLALQVWHSLPGSLLLYGAVLVHLALAFDAILARRKLRLLSLDMLRIVLGLGIPVLLIGHAVSTRVAWQVYAQSPQYSRVVWSLWTARDQGRQLALLVPGWAHGCLGIHLALGRHARYRRLRPALFGIAMLLPLLGALGFLAMGEALAADARIRAQLDAGLVLPATGALALLGLRDSLLVLYVVVVATVFIARGVRASFERRLRESSASGTA